MLFLFLRTFAIGLLGAVIFSLIGLPIPWLLGSMLMTLLFQLKSPWKMVWNPIFRNIGLVFAGYTIGFAFTLDALQEMVRYFPMMFLINIIFFYFIYWCQLRSFEMGPPGYWNSDDMLCSWRITTGGSLCGGAKKI